MSVNPVCYDYVCSEWCEITLRYDGSLDEPAWGAYISLNIPARAGEALYRFFGQIIHFDLYKG